MAIKFCIVILALLKCNIALESSPNKCDGCPDPFKRPVIVKMGEDAPEGITVVGEKKATITAGGDEFCLDQYMWSKCKVTGTTKAGGKLKGVKAVAGKKIVRLELDCENNWEVLLCLPKIELCRLCPGNCQFPMQIIGEGPELIFRPELIVNQDGQQLIITRADGGQFCGGQVEHDERCEFLGGNQIEGQMADALTIIPGDCSYWMITLCWCTEDPPPTTTEPPQDTCTAPADTSKPCEDCPQDCQTKVFLSNLFLPLTYHGLFLPAGMCLKPYAQAVYDENKKSHSLTIILKQDFCIHDFYIEIDKTSPKKVTGLAFTTEGKKKVKFCQTHSGEYRIKGQGLVGKKMNKIKISCKPLKCKILSWVMCICVK